MKSSYEGKTILITGGVGSIGSALLRELLKYNPETIRVLDINETGLFNLKQELNKNNVRFLVGDIRDANRLVRAIEDVDIVFHAAALKHVPLCESNPFEVVQTNVLGTKNLIEAAMQQEVEKLIVISTDKAVNPVNVLGASKLLAERLTISANFYKGKRRTVFSCVRFGNVLNSQGSVLPVFIEQISSGGPVKVTDEGMTRFVMSIDNAVKLVLKASQMAQGGETFILKEMAALRIKDLAEALIAEVAPAYGYNANEIKIEFIGKRDGEKLYEELMNEYEAEIAYETEDMFILSPFNNRKDRGEIQTKV